MANPSTTSVARPLADQRDAAARRAPAGRRATAPVMTTLSLCHLAFLVLVAAYLCTFHRQGEQAVWLMAAVGVVGELLPGALRRWFLAEILLVLGSAVCWLWVMPHGVPDALHATLGMALADWMLVPSRLGMLRWVLSLAIVELVVQGARPHASLAALAIIPIGLGALAVDSWLLGALTAKRGLRLATPPGLSLLRWALIPAALAMIVGIGGGGAVVRRSIAYNAAHDQGHGPHPGRKPDHIAGLGDSLHIGDSQRVDLDPRVAAHLFWETGADPSGLVYLRALALSELTLDGSMLSWRASHSAALVPAPPPAHHPLRWASVWRLPGGGDVILHPDGGEALQDLADVVRDADGNLYSSGLGEVSRIYHADFDEGKIDADPAELAGYSAFPKELESLPWTDLEEPRWRTMTPERAADAVRKALQERCHYSLVDLPTPAGGAGGVIRTFLFGREAERIGHCQYFATSAVLLLRHAGHVARCVVGFASDELDERGVIFRGLHAHAWVEVVDSHGQWLRCDPTPPGGLPQRGALGMGQEDRNEEKPPLPGDVPKADVHTPQAAAERQRTLIVGAAMVCVAAALAWWLLRRRRASDPRLALLQRHTENLFRVAVALGVPVGPATTLTEV
ncbi:MAG: transglutaminase domain-containing protein, partial [Planctomycetes bacterium]|nr:transglutaminase domain-containing protein [Planctomycetota bacterium]